MRNKKSRYKVYFLTVGAQKSGTTTYHKILKSQKEIFMATPKEIHFFTLNHSKGENWYHNYFKNQRQDQIGGEITPFYLFHKEAAKRIYEYNSEMKIIILLRNPIERTISHYFHAKKRGFEHLELQEALEIENKRLAENEPYSYQKHSYLSRSLYIEQISRYEKLFRPENILIMKSEDFFEKPAKSIELTRDFLGLTRETTYETKKIENVGVYETQISKSTKDWLAVRLNETIEIVAKKYKINWL